MQTLCQVVPITAAVVVTTPQKLAFIDVEKGVCCLREIGGAVRSVPRNSYFFEVDGVKHKPFGEGSGAAICEQYGVPNLLQMPIVPDLSACGDTGRPLVLAIRHVAVDERVTRDVAATLVREVAKLEKGKKPRVDIDPGYDGAFRVEIPGENDDKPFWITAKNVRLSTAPRQRERRISRPTPQRHAHSRGHHSVRDVRHRKLRHVRHMARRSQPGGPRSPR